MSTASKLALGASVAFSISIITYVHYKQRVDREKLHEGVVRDLERQQKSKIQNLKMLQDQIELTKVLKAQRDADMEEKMKKANHPVVRK
ncbi:protein PET117 homolog, mitochondrial-like isoform X2 [Liolophura sinensis]|uniref:protein PET117 homolog, mitochondrial-like isoform X2 n=1 Tax=Liolophura sinensis TaxID=3198878 RepID=UPI0031586E62